ncbi:MAG: DUF86 domain-containing protein [Bacteroidaceae bacterium]|nr:DUF86 domain-containing protein [Bacteroidaceae bacterium]
MESLSSEKLPIVWHTLEKLEETVKKLQSRTSSIQSVNDFLSSPMGMEKLDAACMVIIAIGEGIKNLDKITEGKLLATYPSIPWDKVMGARDILAHHYFEVDADVVFYIVKNDLNPLLEAIVFFKQEL